MSDGAFKEFLTAAFKGMAQSGAPGAAVYVWHADSEGLNFRLAMAAAGIPVRQCLVWVKNSMVLGRQDYQWRHEPCLYGWIPGSGHYFIDDRKQTTVHEAEVDLQKLKKQELIEFIQTHLRQVLPETVIREKAPQRSDLHPTMKPIKLITRLMTNSSKQGWLVLDPFAGSGTTLITAEMTGRVARCIELDPYYCDVIVRRYMATFETKNIKCLRNGRIATAAEIEKIYNQEAQE